MEARENIARVIARVVIVIVGLAALSLTMVAAILPWLDIGTLGLGADYRVRPLLHPIPGRPAFVAGVRGGDRFVSVVPDHLVFHSGTATRLTVERDGREMTFPIRVGTALAYSLVDKVIEIVMVATSALALLLSFALALRRPALVTVLLALSSLNVPYMFDSLISSGLFLSYEQGQGLLEMWVLAFTWLPNWAFVLFALAFPRSLWSRRRAIIAIAVLVLACGQAILQLQSPSGSNTLIPVIAALAVFAFSYSRADKSDRPRLTWIMTAIGAYLAVQLLVFVLISTGINTLSYYRVGCTLAALIWLGIIYAVWRRHVVGVAFAVNRGIVVAVITAIVLGMVGIARWFGEHELAHSGIAGIIGVGLTVLVGYGLNRIAGRIQDAIERFVFRRRYLAERRITQAIASLPYATSRNTIANVVVDETSEQLRIASAALFLRTDDGYERIRSLGWPDDSLKAVDVDDRLPRLLHAEGRTQNVRVIGWRPENLPGGEAEPISVFPLAWRGALIGFVLYGRHTDGSDIDPQERSLLKQLADTAAVTYETAENAELRQSVTSLKERLLATLS